MADVVAFPLARRRDFIRRQARYLATQGPHAAEQNLAYQLRKQRETLLSKGITTLDVEAQVQALEMAIRLEAVLHTCGGAA